jgi:hypothetical protein
MKLLGFGHLSVFSIDQCRPHLLQRNTYIENVENSFQKKKISDNFQNLHNLEIYNHNFKIEIISFPDQTNSEKCKSHCSELFTNLIGHANIIYSSSFTIKFFDSIYKLFALEGFENDSISISTLDKRDSIILKFDLQGRAFNSSLGSAGLNSLALYVDKIDIGLLNNLGFTPETDTISIEINGFYYQILFLKLDGVIIELLRRYN